MTQLQKIVEEIKKLEKGPAGLLAWKQAIEEGKQVHLVNILRAELVKNKAWLIEVLGLHIATMIQEFDPLKESDKYLSELMELYKEPKDLRQWDKIRIKVAECNMLLEMAGSKL